MTNTSLQTLDIRLPISSIDAYISYVNQIPLLSEDEERQLAISLRDENNLAAARQLVMAHLRYVVSVARGYQGYGLPLGDLIQEGNVGLMKAVKRFNPAVGVRMVTFAMHWIKAEIHEFVLKNWRIVKVATTKAQRKLFFNLRSMKKHLGWLTNDEVTEVAKNLRVKPETVREMELRLSHTDTPFDGYPDEDDDQFHASPAGYLEDHRFNPQQQVETNEVSDHAQTSLHQALKTLDNRSQEILNARWLAEEKSTLQELADKYQVSAERIRQLEKNAMQKLKTAMADVVTQ